MDKEISTGFLLLHNLGATNFLLILLRHVVVWGVNIESRVADWFDGTLSLRKVKINLGPYLIAPAIVLFACSWAIATFLTFNIWNSSKPIYLIFKILTISATSLGSVAIIGYIIIYRIIGLLKRNKRKIMY